VGGAVGDCFFYTSPFFSYFIFQLGGCKKKEEMLSEVWSEECGVK
jgi:hypothetical protein